MQAFRNAAVVACLVGACSGIETPPSALTRAGAAGGGDTSFNAADSGGNENVPDAGTADAPAPGASDASADAAPKGNITPPLAGSSKGTGGSVPVNGSEVSAQGVAFRLLVPATYRGSPTPLLVVYSGVEGALQMMQNLAILGPSTSTNTFIRIVLDGVNLGGNGQAGAVALDAVRANYNIDNDRTYVMGESAGTVGALKLAFRLRQSYFAAYWANDITASDVPAANATTLGFAPFGQVGPGGNATDATAIVKAMKTAGYRLPTVAPYADTGFNVHGSPEQFVAALSFFSGKTRN
jgi:hypothetical protein